MTEILDPRPNRGLTVEKPQPERIPFEITDLVSRPVPGGWRCSFTQVGENFTAQMSGVFVSLKDVPAVLGLKSYLEANL